jgi:hypothetical protein
MLRHLWAVRVLRVFSQLCCQGQGLLKMGFRRDLWNLLLLFLLKISLKFYLKRKIQRDATITYLLTYLITFLLIYLIISLPN